MSNTEELHPRIDFSKVSPGAVAAMYGVERYVKKSGLDPTLLRNQFRTMVQSAIIN